MVLLLPEFGQIIHVASEHPRLHVGLSLHKSGDSLLAMTVQTCICESLCLHLLSPPLSYIARSHTAFAEEQQQNQDC